MWEKFVQKEYHLCNTDELMRKLQTKIRHRSSTWKQQEVQILHWMNFRWKTFKTATSMKKWSTRESCVFTKTFQLDIACSIPVGGWGVTVKKHHVKNRVKFKKNYSRSSTPSPSAFSENLFFRWRQNAWSQKFRLITVRRSCTTRCAFCIKERMKMQSLKFCC